MARLADEALSHDYDADEKWKAYLESIEFVNDPTPDQLNKLKRKWYQKNVNPSYQPPSAERPSAESAQSTSTSAGTGPSSQHAPPPRSSGEQAAGAQQQPRTATGGMAGWGPRDGAGLRRYVASNKLRTTWLAVHVFFLLQSIWSLVPFVGGGDLAYRRAFKAALVGFLIPLYAAHGKPQFTRMYLEGLLRDSNGQYLLYAIVFLLADPPYFPALAPLVVYSAYHASDVIRRELLLALYPQSRSRRAHKFEQALDQLRGEATQMAAQVEVVNFGALVVLALASLVGLARGSIMPAFGYYQFVRLRYLLSPDTRRVVDAFASHPRCPALVARAITWAFRQQ